MTWKATTVCTGAAPAARVGRAGAVVVIRHGAGGSSGPIDVCVPWLVWITLTRVTRGGRLDRLGPAWTAWTSSGGRSRLVRETVTHGFGYEYRQEVELPLRVWKALATEICVGAVETLPTVTVAELEAERDR